MLDYIRCKIAEFFFGFKGWGWSVGCWLLTKEEVKEWRREVMKALRNKEI